MSGLGFDPHHIDAALTLPTRYEFTAEGVSGALAALGTTPHQIAKTLLDAGIVGDRGCENSCVLAEWAYLTFPGCAAEVQVDGPAGEEEAWLRLTSPGRETLEVPTPDAVATLASEFDHGRHPKLERPRIHDEVTL